MLMNHFIVQHPRAEEDTIMLQAIESFIKRYKGPIKICVKFLLCLMTMTLILWISTGSPVDQILALRDGNYRVFYTVVILLLSR